MNQMDHELVYKQLQQQKVVLEYYKLQWVQHLLRTKSSKERNDNNYNFDYLRHYQYAIRWQN
jgi:hypothetical protein